MKINWLKVSDWLRNMCLDVYRNMGFVIKKLSPGERIFVHHFLCRYLNTSVLFVDNNLIILQTAAGNIINMLWQLMENSLEELKLLQTVLVLLTTSTVVHDEALSKVGNLFVKVHKCLETVFEKTG